MRWPTSRLAVCHFSHMQKLLSRRGCSREDSKDLIQDACLKLQEYRLNCGEVRHDESFLVRTVLNLSMNARRDAHLDLYCDQNVDELVHLVDSNPLPDEVVAAEQCLERMCRVLEVLGQRTQDIFFMHRFDGFTHAQIAQRVGLSVSAVEKHVARALGALEAVLTPNHDRR
jgi:RNA polymerase sigma factor (sigma-70 family)